MQPCARSWPSGLTYRWRVIGLIDAQKPCSVQNSDTDVSFAMVACILRRSRRRGAWRRISPPTGLDPYRLLAANQPVRERRNQLEHPRYTKPELVATGANETWSWDITRLLGPTRWSYFYLYVLLDIFSRYVVGWMVAERENDALAATLIEQTCLKQGIEPQVLTLHSDRGAPMTSKCTAQLLADLGITRSLSRPQVSDDNPFSEAQFKTLKYHPGFPGRFDDIHAAIAFCRSFFPWYNTEHRHGGIAMLTPDDVHHGRAHTVLQQREQTLRAAWSHHPERFVRGIPKPLPLPEAVWINPPATSTSTTGETAQ